MEKQKIKNNLRAVLLDRSPYDLAISLKIRPQAVYYWIAGDTRPHRLRMKEVLKWLSQPFDKPLTEKDVWP